MEIALEQLFNKLDKVVRNHKIRLEYTYYREQIGMKSKDARELLAQKEMISWKGERYFLSEASIEAILNNKPINQPNGEISL